MGWLASESPVANWPREIPTFQRLAALESVAEGGAADGRAADTGAAEDGEAGVDRHNSPSLAKQLEQAQSRPIDTIICSVLDSEPGLRLNAALAARHAEEVVKNVAGLAKQVSAKRALIVVDETAPGHWLEPLQAAARRHKASIVAIPNHYPQADPTMLVYALSGRRLKPGRLLTEAGVILLDGAAAWGLGENVMRARAMLGILDHAERRALYLDVPAATVLGDVLAAAGVGGERRVVFGGDLLREIRLSPRQVVGEGEVAIHILPAGPGRVVRPCIRCGWCADICPTGVKPAWILEAAQRGDAHLAERGGRDACIECGLCDQICPSQLPLLAAIRSIRTA